MISLILCGFISGFSVLNAVLRSPDDLLLEQCSQQASTLMAAGMSREERSYCHDYQCRAYG